MGVISLLCRRIAMGRCTRRRARLTVKQAVTQGDGYQNGECGVEPVGGVRFDVQHAQVDRQKDQRDRRHQQEHLYDQPKVISKQPPKIVVVHDGLFEFAGERCVATRTNQV